MHQVLWSRAIRRGLSRRGCGLGPTRGDQSTGENDRKSPPDGAMQSRQKHSILSLQKLMVKTQRLLGIKRWYAKRRAPGFIFVSKALYVRRARFFSTRPTSLR